MMKNYFKPETKSFKVIELLNAGKTYDEIVETMKYKSKNSVSNVVSRWRTKDLLNKKRKPQPENPNLTVPEEPQTQTSTIITDIPPQVGYRKPMDDMGRNVVQIEGYAPSRSIALTPKNITLIQWFTAKFDYAGDLSDFINDAVEDFFQSRNYQFKVIKEEIIQ